MGGYMVKGHLTGVVYMGTVLLPFMLTCPSSIAGGF